MNPGTLTKLTIAPGAVETLCGDLLREDSATMDPWMLYRLENIRAGAKGEREFLENNCEEYVK